MIYSAVFFQFVLTFCAAGADKQLLGDVNDGSRAVAVHLIPLIDEEGGKIIPDYVPVLPFSVRQTCSDCHDYGKVSRGWHFNAVDPNIPTGRNGQPWILVDSAIATQIPLSYRAWPGTYRPQQLGVSAWQFVQLFGRQMPGGGPGELLDKSDKPEEIIRSFVSGKLEINCLTCHNAHPGQDQAEYAVQIARQNFRWAATAASEFASVTGIAKDLPDTYDYLMPAVMDDTRLRPPAVTYRGNIFDDKKNVLFDIVRKVPNNRCYFCHSNRDIDKARPSKWTKDEDVHLAAGLLCVDCHRNGLEHNITRGYEDEASVSANPLAAVSSCKGCHMPQGSSASPTAGRLGAPIPKHAGIPPVHFDKLTCTACHSGPWPVQKTYRTQTARAHGLGVHNIIKSDEMLPHIMSPVFARGPDGKIGAHKLFWPAFWASLKDKKVTPLNLEIVRRTAGVILAKTKRPGSGDWLSLTSENIIEILKSLSSDKTIDGQAVYICGGKIYRLDDSRLLVEEEHPAAGAYLWPIAHDVRPAAQSLGVRGCSDCHSTEGAFFFGDVEVDSPLKNQKNMVKKMVDFQELDPVYARRFAFTFVFRPWLKVVTLGFCAILAAVVLLYALKALGFIAKIFAGKEK